MSQLTPRELLFQVREMADPSGSQVFDNDVARLRAIVEHIEGNLLDDAPPARELPRELDGEGE